MIEILKKGLKADLSQSDKTLRYILSLQNSDGGFRGRTAQSDLYYTVFAVDVLCAAGAEFDRSGLMRYIRAFEPENLDFVHVCCLIRCAAVMNILEAGLKSKILSRFKQFLCGDGLYHHVQAGQNGSVYGTFMAFSASQDLKEILIDPAKLLSVLNKFCNSNGSYKNEYGQGAGTLPSTAAAMVMHAQLENPPDQAAIQWIFSCMTEEDGFAVSPRLPVADLLSTATALEALRQAGADTSSFREQCRVFAASLRQANGGFCANSFDPAVDAEYTFYGLLAIGNLHE
jgi:hypothetical protein